MSDINDVSPASLNNWLFLFKDMTWKDINVFQWQQITDLFTKESKDLTDLDMAVKATAIVMGLTEHQIDSLPIDKLKPLLEQVSFLHMEIKPDPAKYIKANGKRYRCIYDIRKMPAARYIEAKYFSDDTNGNLHKLAACMVMPQKRNWLGRWVDDKYDASRHSEYANDMLSAPIVNVLGSVVFFYQVYNNWIRSSKDYLIAEMMKAGMTQAQVDIMAHLLSTSMDGIIPVTLLPTKKISELKRYLK